MVVPVPDSAVSDEGTHLFCKARNRLLLFHVGYEISDNVAPSDSVIGHAEPFQVPDGRFRYGIVGFVVVAAAGHGSPALNPKHAACLFHNQAFLRKRRKNFYFHDPGRLGLL